MSFRIIDTLTAGLRRLSPKVRRDAEQEIRKGAGQILQLAQRQAPIDMGNLEDAIRSKEVRSGFNNLVVYIYVDEDMPIPERPGKVIGDYAVFTHDGDYELGPRSAEKQANNPDVLVGPKYLERALDTLAGDIMRSVKMQLLRGY
jgi:hypothetical protein